ncbi:hypothetical protein [Streptomyces litmocidini]|uniref:hypothetical protein n=1 Tax=Streptomyces litmocidini TaxID=67318 RepID=UPI0036FD3D07
MRSARILFAAAATAGTLALAAPGAYAITAGDWDGSSHSQESDHGKPKGGMHTGSGALSLVSGDEWSKEHSKGDKSEEHGKGDKSEKEHDKGDRYEKEHEKPKGGMHTGSGALSLVNADDWTKDTEKDKQKDWTKDTEKDEDGYKSEKPKGGMHTGGGGLASGTTNVTGAALVVGGLAAFVLHRRRKAAGAAA